jgi:hypothetical protein
MTYQALLAGATGIIYYTYHDQSGIYRHPTRLWAGNENFSAGN